MRKDLKNIKELIALAQRLSLEGHKWYGYDSFKHEYSRGQSEGRILVVCEGVESGDRIGTTAAGNYIATSINHDGGIRLYSHLHKAKKVHKVTINNSTYILSSSGISYESEHNRDAQKYEKDIACVRDAILELKIEIKIAKIKKSGNRKRTKLLKKIDNIKRLSLMVDCDGEKAARDLEKANSDLKKIIEEENGNFIKKKELITAEKMQLKSGKKKTLAEELLLPLKYIGERLGITKKATPPDAIED